MSTEPWENASENTDLYRRLIPDEHRNHLRQLFPFSTSVPSTSPGHTEAVFAGAI